MARYRPHTDRRVWAAALGGAFAWWLVGQGARDRWLLTAWGFYIPSLFLAATLAGSAAFAWGKRWRGLALCAVVLAVIPAYAALFRENHWAAHHIAQNSAPTMRLLHWNVNNAPFGWPRVAERVKAITPDIVFLSEARRLADMQPLVDALGKEFALVHAADMAVLARGQLFVPERIPIPKGRMYLVKWRYHDNDVSLLIVDLPANVFVPRDPRLRRVADVIAARKPDLIVGDFNAPRNSRRLAPLPDGFVHAYDAVGWGWSATWPIVAPLWSIDQCIVGRQIEPVAYDLRSSIVSDHRMQVFDFRVRKAGP